MLILLKKINISVFFLTYMVSVFAQVDSPIIENKSLTKAEIQKGMQLIKQDLYDRIDAWGETLKPTDFERSLFSGRQLNKEKRQEVCAIFQGVIDRSYKLAVENKSRLPEVDHKMIEDRNLFIQNFGYKDNIVDTKMGFNCRLR